VLHRAEDDSVFLHTWPALPAVADAEALLAKWGEIRRARAEVQRVLETLRAEGRIGSSLQAEVEVRASGDRHAALASLGDDLRFVLITSAALLTRADTPADETIIAVPSPHAKCERCWHYRADVGAAPAHPTICGRCVENLDGAGEPRSHA
jgi:isoleucyl-tRNA synthetase